MTTIDDRLKDFASYCTASAPNFGALPYDQNKLKQINKTIKADILEIIGEDDEAPTAEYLNEYAKMYGRDNSDYAQLHNAFQANRVRAYYRAKLNEYFK